MLEDPRCLPGSYSPLFNLRGGRTGAKRLVLLCRYPYKWCYKDRYRHDQRGTEWHCLSIALPRPVIEPTAAILHFYVTTTEQRLLPGRDKLTQQQHSNISLFNALMQEAVSAGFGQFRVVGYQGLSYL